MEFLSKNYIFLNKKLYISLRKTIYFLAKNYIPFAQKVYTFLEEPTFDSFFDHIN